MVLLISFSAGFFHWTVFSHLCRPSAAFLAVREDGSGEGLALKSASALSPSVKARSLHASCHQWQVAEVQYCNPGEEAALQAGNQAPRVSCFCSRWDGAL